MAQLGLELYEKQAADCRLAAAKGCHESISAFALATTLYSATIVCALQLVMGHEPYRELSLGLVNCKTSVGRIESSQAGSSMLDTV